MDGEMLSYRMLICVIVCLTCVLSAVVCVPFQNNPELFARLVEPPPRHVYKSTEPRIQEKCSEKNWQKNQHLCSACGNVPHDFHRDYKIRRKYYPGKLLPIILSLSQAKEGYIEFRICSNGFGSTINHKCFQNNQLFIEETQSSRLYVPAMAGNITTSLIIPPEVSCDRYVLQWKYVLGDEYDGDCKHCVTYVGCANIAILDPSVSEDMPKSRQKRQTDNSNNGEAEVATSVQQGPVSGNKFNLAGLADALSTSLGNFLFGSKPTHESTIAHQDRTAQTLENSPINSISDFGSIKKVHSVNYLIDSKDIPTSLTNILSNKGDLGTIVNSRNSAIMDTNTGIKNTDKSTMSFKTDGKPTSIKQFDTKEHTISIPLEVLNSFPNAKNDKMAVNTVQTGSETVKEQRNRFNIDGLANVLSTSLGRMLFGSSDSKFNPKDRVSNQLEITDQGYHIQPITHSKKFDFSRVESKDISEPSLEPVVKSVNIWHPVKNVFKSETNDVLQGLPIGFQESNQNILVRDVNFKQPSIVVPVEGLVNVGSGGKEKNNENRKNQQNRKRFNLDGLADSLSTSLGRKMFGSSKSNTGPVKAKGVDKSSIENLIIPKPSLDINHAKPTNFSPRKIHQFFDLSRVDSKDISEPLITFLDHKSQDGIQRSNNKMAAFGVQPRIVQENWGTNRFENEKQNLMFNLPIGFQTANTQTETRPFEPTDSSLAIPPEIVVAGSTSRAMATDGGNTAAMATAAVIAASDGGISDTLGDAASGLKDVVSGTVDNVKDATGSAVDAMSDVISSASDAASSVGDVVSDASSNVGEAISGLQDNLPEIVPKSIDAVSDMTSSAVDTMSDMISSAKDTMSDIVSSAADTVSDVVPSMGDSSMGEVISDVASSAGEAVSGLKDALPDSLSDVVPAIGDTSVSEVISEAASNVGEAVSGFQDALPDSLPKIVPAIGDSSVSEVVSDIASTVGDALSDAVGDSSVAEVVGEAVSGLKDALPDIGDSSVGEIVSEAAGEAVSGLADALPDSISDAVSGVGDIASDLSDALPAIVPGEGVMDAAADVVENIVDDSANIADVMGDITSDVSDVVSDVVDDTKLVVMPPPPIVPDASISDIIGAVANKAAVSAVVDAVSDAVDDSKLGVGDVVFDVKDTISDIVDDGLKDAVSPTVDNIGDVVPDDSILSKALDAASDMKDNVGDMVSETKDTLSSIIGESPSNALEKIADGVSDVVDNVKDLGSDMRDSMGVGSAFDLIDNIKDIGSDMKDSMGVGSVSDMVDNIKDVASDMKDSIGVGSVSDMVDNIKDVGSDMKDSIGVGSVSDIVDNIKDVGSNMKDVLDDSASAAILLSGFKPVIGDVSKGKQISIRPHSSSFNSNLNLFQIPPSPFEQIQMTRTRNPPIFDDMPPPPPPPSIILKDASSFPDSGENIKDSKINIIPLDARKTSPNFIPVFEKDDGRLKLKSKKDDKNLVSLSDSMLYVLAGDYGKYQLGLDKIVSLDPKDSAMNVGTDDRKLRLPATTQTGTLGSGSDAAATIIAVSEASAIGDSLSDVLEKVAIGDDKDKLFKLPDDVKENSLLGKLNDRVDKIGDIVSDTKDTISDIVDSSVAGDIVDNSMDKMSDIVETTGEVMSDVTDKISDTASDISSNIKDRISDVVDSSIDAASNVGEVVSDIASNVEDALSDVASNAGDVVSDMRDKVSDVVDAGLDTASNVGDAILDVRSNARDVVSDVVDKAGDAASNMVDTASDMRDTVQDVGSNIVDSITDNSWGKVLSNAGEGMSNLRENTKDVISNVVDAQADAFSNVRDTISNVADAGKDVISGMTDRVSDLGGGLDSDKLRNLAIVNSLQNTGTNSAQPNLPITGRNTLDASFLTNALGERSGKVATTGVNLVTFFKTSTSGSSNNDAGNLIGRTSTSNVLAGDSSSLLSLPNIVPISSTNINSNTGGNIGLFKAAVDLNSASASNQDQNAGLFRPGVGLNPDLSSSTGRNIGLLRPGIGLNPDSSLTNTVPSNSNSADSVNLWTWSSKQSSVKTTPSVNPVDAVDRMAFRRVPSSVNLQDNQQSNSALENFLLNGVSTKSSTFDRSRSINEASTRDLFSVNTNLEAISGNVITRSPPPVGKPLDSAIGFQGTRFLGTTRNSLDFNSARGAAFRNQRRSLTVNTQVPVIGVKSKTVGNVISPLLRPGLAEVREIQPSTSSLRNAGNVITGTGNTGSDLPPTNFVSMSRINSEEYSSLINNGPEVLPGRHSPVSMIGVCRLNEEFDCQASGSFSKVPGIDWWCVTNCREGNCKQEQCKCHCLSKTDQSKRVVTADEINRIIALQRETEIRLRNIQLTHRQYKLAANMNCKPTPAYTAVENINKWCNIICAMGKCPTHVCSCPP